MYNAYLTSQPSLFNTRPQRPLDVTRTQYMAIVELLPLEARRRQWPLSNSKEFSRVLLDNICECDWRVLLDARKGAVYRQLTIEQLRDGIMMAQGWITGDDSLLVEAVDRSRKWRNA